MKLPSVFANKIDKEIKNNEDFYYGDRKIVSNKEVESLRDYFDSMGYAHKLEVDIETNDGIRNERLILCKKDYVINIDNEKIYFKDIIGYKIKK